MPQRLFYWVTGKIDGKVHLLGKYETESEADDMGFKAFKNSPYEIHPLPTSNRVKATQMLKHKFFEDSGDLQGSMVPVSHKPPKSGGTTA